MNEVEQKVVTDPRVQQLRKTYNDLIRRKNMLIMEISNIEADIIKNVGIFEAIAKEISGEFAKEVSTPAPGSTEPVPATTAGGAETVDLGHAGDSVNQGSAQSSSEVPAEKGCGDGPCTKEGGCDCERRN